MRTFSLCLLFCSAVLIGCQPRTTASQPVPDSHSAAADPSEISLGPSIRIRTTAEHRSDGNNDTAQPQPAADPLQSQQPTKTIVELPGAVVNMVQRYVELEGTVCLREGLLELIATMPNSKEHEAIVALRTVPSSIHAGLLMLGCTPGEPGSWTYTPTEVISHDPSGDRVRVTLLVEEDGKWVEHPISHFVMGRDEKSKLPGDEFVFSGSKMAQIEGREVYVADITGDVVSLVTFGTDVISWPTATSDSNDQLFWLANPKTVPPLGTPVRLRLYPQPAKGGK